MLDLVSDRRICWPAQESSSRLPTGASQKALMEPNAGASWDAWNSKSKYSVHCAQYAHINKLDICPSPFLADAGFCRILHAQVWRKKWFFQWSLLDWRGQMWATLMVVKLYFFFEYLPKGDSSETSEVLEASRCKCLWIGCKKSVKNFSIAQIFFREHVDGI